MKTKDRNAKRDIRKELKILSKEERKRQQLAIGDVLKTSDVVLTTLTGAASRKLDNITFDLVIIDEAAQALEIACWIALLKVHTRFFNCIFMPCVLEYKNDTVVTFLSFHVSKIF